ncbi:cache domain-containing sensor histidine kinase [Halalkalibacter akibai]|uniref:Two-component sensor histidine kinase n=1 Tax=Halalkalibacter akibai (strain ATCC 43226 / DSM 21942 / CIP 109018 / JCM 9157 / 1139) TaxID=1236973 RepID=W4QUS6_HALA3|nr:sensor histidine kinase [Halalkalibacter akibai]GAE35368.1 two-component sensor histidine kinase [Halalkalibacter akibai JCM 9157]
MKTLIERLKFNSLFLKLFLLTFIIIISVSVAITMTTLRLSERLFIDTFSITNAKVLNQIKENFEGYNYSIINSANHLQQNGAIRTLLSEEQTNRDLMNAYYHLSTQMELVKSNFERYETGIMITGINGVTFSSDRSYWPFPDEVWLEHEVLLNTWEEPRWLQYQTYETPNHGQVIVASKTLIERISREGYGTVHFAMNESDFSQFYQTFTSPGNDVYMIDRQGQIVSSNVEEMIQQKNTALLEAAMDVANSDKDYINLDLLGKEHIVLVEYLPFFDMYLVNAINRDVVSAAVIDKKSIALYSIGTVLLALIIVFFISRKLTNSLSTLVKQIGNASKHDFHQYVTVTGAYETRQIGIAFNAMLDEIHEYVEQVMLSQKKQRNAELAALQQQINPHFLYNTLTTIKFLVQQGSKEEATETIHSLISLLQNTIGNVDEIVTVDQEIANLKNYVFINQKRYGNRIKVNYFIGPDCINFQVPKLILQPFVENAFFHGFNKKEAGSIHIMVWQESDKLICEVMDNGDGMSRSNNNKLPKTKRKSQHFSGIGIRNVHERIQLLYGDMYGVEIESEEEEGTKVRISLPLAKE